MTRSKGLTRCKMLYGLRDDDMKIVERVCQRHDVDPEWLKEQVLRTYQTEKNNKTDMSDQNEVLKLLKKALRHI